MPTLHDLTTALGDDLAAVTGLPGGSVEITAVHVSELADPTAFLSGGELLLTTGMKLTGHAAQARSYVARLVASGVAALGFGLGPVHDDLPETLRNACASAGLPLLVVPPPTPFLAVSRAFWQQLVADEKAGLDASLGAYRELVRSATRRDPTAHVVRTLGHAISGWAARLDAEGKVLDVWPHTGREAAVQAATEIDRMHAAGPHASATFPVGLDDVVIQPLGRGARLIGYVVIGCPRPMPPADRQLHLAACSLLALQLDRDHQSVVRRRTERACVARLALEGQLDAARALVDALGQDRLPARVRLVAIREGPELTSTDLLDRWEHAEFDDRRLWVASEKEAVWALVEASVADFVLADLRELAARTPKAVPGGLAAVAGGQVAASLLPAELSHLSAALNSTAAGQVCESSGAAATSRANESIRMLREHKDGMLVDTVAAYLRRRGHWEQAAREVGVHRNTLRHRIEMAASIARIDLDDPDQASRLWLALRDQGLA